MELGTYYGVSYCAFCQAVQEVGATTKCYAIDSWEGDPQSRYFGTDVLADLKAYHDPLYGSFSRLIQSSFKEASELFDSASIDLLHIDGYHSYDAVKQDFDTWLTKMSANGVMLFHDISVHENGFGVWQLWEELKTRYPHFEFSHGYGLGLIAVGAIQPGALQALLETGDLEATRIKKYFERLGASREWYAMTQATDSIRERRIRELEAFVDQVRGNPLFRIYHWAKYLGRK